MGVSSTIKIVFCGGALAIVSLQFERQASGNASKRIECRLEIEIANQIGESSNLRLGQHLRQPGSSLKYEIRGIAIVILQQCFQSRQQLDYYGDWVPGVRGIHHLRYVLARQGRPYGSNYDIEGMCELIECLLNVISSTERILRLSGNLRQRGRAEIGSSAL